ncbi:MAG: hypothetical protein WCR30_01290 [Clostridia bacterium]
MEKFDEILNEVLETNKVVEINLDTLSKESMFKLGIIFARGQQIKIVNIDEVNQRIEEEKQKSYAKSFNMMAKYWQDNKLSAKLSTHASDKKIFTICPVRNATKEQIEAINKRICCLKKKGYFVHYPETDTNQNPYVNGVNTGGYNICLQNAQAISNAKNIFIFYDKTSYGTVFDLGVAYYLQKVYSDLKFKLLNENEFVCDPNDFSSKVVNNLIGHKKSEKSQAL